MVKIFNMKIYRYFDVNIKIVIRLLSNMVE